LQAQDTFGGDALNLTRKFLCQMMGVRRISVSGGANKLQEDGLITYKRGVTHIVNRKSLEKYLRMLRRHSPCDRRRHAARVAESR